MKKIFIIDSDKNVYALLRAILSSEEYEIEIAESGYEVIDLIVDNRPDLVIIDIETFYSEGIELVENLFLDVDFSNLNFLIISPYLKSMQLDHCKGLMGQNPLVVSKPIETNEFQEALQSLLIKSS